MTREVFAIPASFAQQRLWLVDQLVPDRASYNIFRAVRLTGRLDAAALERAIAEIVRRHESLRTTFRVIGDEPRQVISGDVEFALPFIDLGGLTPAGREAEAKRLAAEEAQRPFDLSRGPLLRATLIRLSENEHVALMTVHHIVSDGWSMGVFFRELGALYKAFSAGRPSPLPELPIQYADFAVWQRQWLQGERLQKQLDYWKTQLGDNPPVLDLPTDYPRTAVKTYRGATESFVLPRAISASLKALGGREGTTLFMTLLAAFKALLYRHTGQSEIVVGTPIANRGRHEVEGLIGFFVNTLALRSRVRPDDTFLDLLRRVREVAVGAYAHQDLPFERLVEELQPERSLSHTPLFQVMFVLQDPQSSAFELGGLSLSAVEVEGGGAKFDLTLAVEETEAGLVCAFEYSTDLFSGTTIARLAGHFRNLIEGAVADPGRRISELPLLTEGERHQLLVEWNDTRSEYPRDALIQELFEEQAARTPAAVAVICEGERLTYEELNRRANQLAHYLRKRGVGAETLVGICVERSIEMLVAVIGVLKAGGAYVPLDPQYPQERLAFMLEDTRSPVLLTQRRLLDRLPLAHEAHVFCLDSDCEKLRAEPGDNVSCAGLAEHLAYMIYTSGSTGRPKGVMISHRNLVHSTFERFHFYRRPVEVYLLLSSFAFDSSVAGIFWTLCRGGALLLPPEGAQRDVEQLASQVAEHRVSHLLCLPSLYSLLLELAGRADLTSLRAAIVAGEACPAELLELHRRTLPETSLFNEYGPTEGTVWCSVYEYLPQHAGGAVPIGRQIANTEIYLLDERLNPVPVGVAGELYLGGDGLARGYHHRPELTAEKFLPHPFSREPGARLYRTGDLARYLADGNIEFLGRVDHQVKLRGFRIELGEVEAALAGHPLVREAAALVREDVKGDRRLVAYVVAAERGQEPARDELRSYLRERLPDYMVPGAFVLLEELPLNANGKVDRRALPAPEQTHGSMESSFVAPRTHTENVLAGIWAEAIGVERVGLSDNFFELGGHSLLATQIISRVRAALQVELPLRSFFETATLAELAEAVERARAEQHGDAPEVGIEVWETEGKPVMRELIARARHGMSGSGRPGGEADATLVSIQPRGSKRPFFCAHAMSGSVSSYYELARQLGDDQPFFGLQALGLDGRDSPVNRIEDMAAHYAEVIRRTQPSGPYLLGGWSFGGYVAYETARQLSARGEAIGLLALFDTGAPDGTLPAEMDTAKLLVEMVESFTDALRLTADELRRLEPEEQLTRVWEGLKEQRLVPPGFGLEWFRGYFNVVRANYEAMTTYRPQPYAGQLTLFRAGDREEDGAEDPTLGWGRLAEGGVDVQFVPGSHGSIIIGADVHQLAARLGRYLGRVAEVSAVAGD